jgi:hypothetical protein
LLVAIHTTVVPDAAKQIIKPSWPQILPWHNFIFVPIYRNVLHSTVSIYFLNTAAVSRDGQYMVQSLPIRPPKNLYVLVKVPALMVTSFICLWSIVGKFIKNMLKLSITISMEWMTINYITNIHNANFTVVYGIEVQ